LDETEWKIYRDYKRIVYETAKQKTIVEKKVSGLIREGNVPPQNSRFVTQP
jgi:hypothetical protein